MTAKVNRKFDFDRQNIHHTNGYFFGRFFRLFRELGLGERGRLCLKVLEVLLNRQSLKMDSIGEDVKCWSSGGGGVSRLLLYVIFFFFKKHTTIAQPFQHSSWCLYVELALRIFFSFLMKYLHQQKPNNGSLCLKNPKEVLFLKKEFQSPLFPHCRQVDTFEADGISIRPLLLLLPIRWQL